MNKKLLAVAVAGAFLAVPVAAFAQTTVTITGKVHATFAQFKYNNSVAVGNKSQTEVKDESSAVRFLVREDLGGGLAAIGKFDLRMSTDLGAAANTGESYVGLTSPAWGTVFLGRTDLHYGNHASFAGAYSSLFTNPVAIFDRAGVGTVNIAGLTRTDNVVRYGSPKFGNMFEINVAYSANPTPAAGEVDLKVAATKGHAWNINPKIWGKNWEAAYSNWTARGDGGANASGAVAGTAAAVGGAAAAAAGNNKHRGDSLYGWYKWEGLRVGLAYNKSRTTSFAGVVTSNRNAWGLPISYEWGNHHLFADFFRARNDRAAGFAGLDTKANSFSLTYAYDLSKRTSVAAFYTRINNGAAAGYNIFTTTAAGGALAAGEDPRATGVSLNHRF